MCDVGNKRNDLVVILSIGIPSRELTSNVLARYEDYALLVLATDTPIDRAITYLRDTGSPENASGRLLLRAAERALREAGDID